MDDSEYVKCITSFLELYFDKKGKQLALNNNPIDVFKMSFFADELIKSYTISNEQTCKSLWENIDPCLCNLEMIMKKSGNLERLAKRKERKLLIYNLTDLRENADQDNDDDEFFVCFIIHMHLILYS